MNALGRVLAHARKAGFAEVRDGNVEGASGVSAPIFHKNVARAALNLGSPSSRFNAAQISMRKAVVEGAVEVTRLLARGTQLIVPATALLLKSSLAIPEVANVTLTPGLVARPVLGHLFAIGVERRERSPLLSTAAKFFADMSAWTVRPGQCESSYRRSRIWYSKVRPGTRIRSSRMVRSSNSWKSPGSSSCGIPKRTPPMPASRP